MTIKSEYPEVVTFGIYNTGDFVNAIALHDGTLGTRASDSWTPPKGTSDVKIIFKMLLREVASQNVATGGTVTLQDSGKIVSS